MLKFVKATMVAAVAVLALAPSQPAAAQNNGNGNNKSGKMMVSRQRIKSQKIAFFTQELNLTSEEAAKFWPVYNKCFKEGMEARKITRESQRSLAKAAADSSSASDSEIRNLAETFYRNYEKEGTMAAKFFSEYQKVLPVKKAAMVSVVEERFKGVLIHQLRGRSPQNRQQNGQQHKQGNGAIN